MLELIDDPLGLHRGVSPLLFEPLDCLQNLLAPLGGELAQKATLTDPEVPVKALEVSPLRHHLRFHCTFCDHDPIQ
jgi:hypothetical protein